MFKFCFCNSQKVKKIVSQLTYKMIEKGKTIEFFDKYLIICMYIQQRPTKIMEEASLSQNEFNCGHKICDLGSAISVEGLTIQGTQIGYV